MIEADTDEETREEEPSANAHRVLDQGPGDQKG